MRLRDLITTYKPWPEHHPDTWLGTARQHWTAEPEYMRRLMVAMRDGWVGGPAEVSPVTLTVGDGHHRITIALGLGLEEVPVTYVD